MDYKKAYALLVGTISNAIDAIGDQGSATQGAELAVKMLREGLEKAEEMYLSCGE